MTIYIKDPATDRAVRKLAKLRGVSLTEAIRLAVKQALDEVRPRTPADRLKSIRAIQDEFARMPKSGLKADKAFFDELSGDP